MSAWHTIRTPPSMQTVRGKVVVITGASSGIGRAAAHELALLGADVTVLARRPEALAEVIEKELTGILTKTRLANRVIYAAALGAGNLWFRREPQPASGRDEMFAALQDWVEKGTAPGEMTLVSADRTVS